jgi:hypothetical protein
MNPSGKDGWHPPGPPPSHQGVDQLGQQQSRPLGSYGYVQKETHNSYDLDILLTVSFSSCSKALLFSSSPCQCSPLRRPWSSSTNRLRDSSRSLSSCQPADGTHITNLGRYHPTSASSPTASTIWPAPATADRSWTLASRHRPGHATLLSAVVSCS